MASLASERAPIHARPSAATWIVALAALFAFRLVFGLTRELFFEDHTQIFLMGLRHYATGAWPYFGADVVWTKSEIPGALQPLLVGIPLKLVAIPEAPYVLIALLSMVSLSAFAWYVTRRLPQLPGWLVWGWLMTLPWTLEMSNHIINPSYLLAPAVWFFIGFFEAVPVFRLGTLSRPVAFALMGLAVAWVMQIHMSWPLLLPFAGFAWLSGRTMGVPVFSVIHARVCLGRTTTHAAPSMWTPLPRVFCEGPASAQGTSSERARSIGRGPHEALRTRTHVVVDRPHERCADLALPVRPTPAGLTGDAP